MSKNPKRALTDKLSRPRTLKSTIPAKAAPLLAACAGFAGVSEQEYIRRALFASLECDTDCIRADARAALAELERRKHE